jgi:hypothetical protein
MLSMCLTSKMISVILFPMWMTTIILKRVHAAGWPKLSDVALQTGGNHDLRRHCPSPG